VASHILVEGCPLWVSLIGGDGAGDEAVCHVLQEAQKAKSLEALDVAEGTTEGRTTVHTAKRSLPRSPRVCCLMLEVPRPAMEGLGLHKHRMAVPAGHRKHRSSCPDMAQRVVLQNRLLSSRPRQETHARESSGCAMSSLGQTACPSHLCRHIADNVENLPLGKDEEGGHRAHGPDKEDERGLRQHRRIDKKRRLAL